MFGGFYFAGTGQSPTSQAFAPGVFARLIHDQDEVTWTADYIEEDASFHRLARYFKAFLIVFLTLGSVLAVVLLLLLVFRGGDGSDVSPA